MSVFARIEDEKNKKEQGGVFARINEENRSFTREVSSQLSPYNIPLLNQAKEWEKQGKPGLVQEPLIKGQTELKPLPDGMSGSHPKTEDLPGRNIPVVGNVLRGLDAISSSKANPFAWMAQQSIPDSPMIGRREDGTYGNLAGPTARQQFATKHPLQSSGSKGLDKTAEITGMLSSYFLNPSAPSQGPVALYNALSGLGATRAFQGATKGIQSDLGRRVATESAREGLAASAYALPHSLIQGDTSAREIAQNVALEGALGVVGGAIFPLIGAGARKLIDKYRRPQTEMLALPEGRRDQRMREAFQRGVNEPGTEPIINPHTFGLPEASTSLRAQVKNVEESRNDLKLIDNEIRELQNKYTQAINDEYKYLKESMANRGGVRQGNLIRDEHGDVVGRFGRISENPQWYREFYAQYGRKPTNRELYDLAKQRVDEGFREEIYEVPSWKVENQYDETLTALSSVREQIENSLRELDPAIKITDSPLKDSQLKVKGGRMIVDREVSKTESIKQDIPTLENTTIQPSSSLKDDALEILSELFPSQGVGFSALERPSPYRASNKDTKSQLVSKLDREPFSASEKANQLYIDFVDDLHRLNQFDRFVERKLGELKPTERVHDLALASRGSDIIANQILTNGVVDIQGNVVGKSLKEVLAPLPRRSFVDFEDYLVNRHAITRYERGEKVFDKAKEWTPEKGMEKIAELEQRYPMFPQVANEYYQFNRNLLEKWLVEPGIISAEQASKWREENPFYVPMKRQFSDLEKRGKGRTKRGFADQSSPVKGYSKTGSERKIISPIESTIEYVDAFVKTAKRNQAVQALVRNIQRNPEDFRDWVEIVEKPSKLDDITEVDISTVEGIEDLLTRLSDDFDKLTKRDLDKDNVVRVMMDGKPVHLKVNDRQLLEAMLAIGPEGQNWLLDSIGQVTRVFKVLTTGINPVFGLARNLPRDIVQGYIARRNSSLPQFGKDLVESFVAALGNRELFQSYKNIGGGHSSAVAADRNLLAQSKRSILPQNRIKSSIPNVYSSVENFMNALESVPRLGEYKRAGRSYDQRLKGLRDAQDITVNFKRRGRLARQIDKVFPYFNAAMQGLDKLARMYKENPSKAMVRSFMGVSVPTIVLYALNYNNPEYQKVSKHVRDNYFLIPKGDGTFYRVAKHRELGIPFSAMVERALDNWLQEDPVAFRNFSNSVRIAFAPPGLSGFLEKGSLTERPLGVLQDTILGPMVDLAKNENFAGIPIVPANLERLSPEHQYDERTSEVSKAISRLTKRISDKTGIDITTSPKQLDHLIRSYTGILGQIGLPATTEGTSVSETLARQITTDPVYSNDTQNIFYETKERLDRAYNDFRATGEQSNNYDEDMRTVFNQVSNIMAELRAASREIETSDIPSKDKKKYLREIRSKINELADKTNKMYREYKK